MSVTYLPDSRRAAIAIHDGTVRLWDASNGRLLHIFKGHTGPVWAVAASEDGKWIASGSSDHTVRVWEIASGDQIALLNGHTGIVRGVGFLADGRLVSGGSDGIRIWDVKSEQMIWHPQEGVQVFSMAVSHDGSRCAAIDQLDGVTHVWDLNARKEIRTDGGGMLNHNCVGLSPDGKTLYSLGIGNEGGLSAIDVASGKPVDLSAGRGAAPIALSSDGRLLATYSNAIEIWDTKTWQLAAAFDPLINAFGETPNAMAIAPDGKHMIAALGGAETPDGGWKPPRQNQVTVYSIRPNPPTVEVPSVVTTGGGRVTRVAIPGILKTKAGQTMPMARVHLGIREITPVDATTDLVWSQRSILLLRAGGVLQEIYEAGGKNLDGAVWDGKNIWVATPADTLVALDLNGTVIATVTKSAQLPLANANYFFHTLEEGRLLVIGGYGEFIKQDFFNPANQTKVVVPAWCSLLTRDPKSGAVDAKLLFTSEKMPAEWPKMIFNPNWVSEPPHAPGTPRVVYIGSQTDYKFFPAIRIAVDTLAVSVYNLAPAGQKPPKKAGYLALKPFWLSERTALVPNGQLLFVTLGDTFIDEAAIKKIGPNTERYPQTLYAKDGRIYTPGPQWSAINPATLEVEDLGPAPVPDLTQDKVATRYFQSAALGIAAVNEQEGNFYTHTINALAVKRSIAFQGDRLVVPPEGAIEYQGEKLAAVMCPAGSFAISKGQAFQTNKFMSFSFSLVDYGQRVGAIRERVVGASKFGVHLTVDQSTRLVAALNDNNFLAPPNVANLQKLIAAYQAAPQGPAQDRAGKEMIEEVRALTALQTAARDKQLAAIKAVLTPEQWTVLGE